MVHLVAHNTLCMSLVSKVDWLPERGSFSIFNHRWR